jgi:hypothetical protein
MHVTLYGPFFFLETTIAGIVYMDMLQQFLIPESCKALFETPYIFCGVNAEFDNIR